MRDGPQADSSYRFETLRCRFGNQTQTYYHP